MKKPLLFIAILLSSILYLPAQNVQLEYNAGFSRILIQFPNTSMTPFKQGFSHQFRGQLEVFSFGKAAFNAGVLFTGFNAELDNGNMIENIFIQQYGEIPENVEIRNFGYSGLMLGSMIQFNYRLFENASFAIKPALGFDLGYVFNETMTNSMHDHFATFFYGNQLLEKEINSVEILDRLYVGSHLRFYFYIPVQGFTIVAGPGIDYQLNNILKPEHNKHVIINYGLSFGIQF